MPVKRRYTFTRPDDADQYTFMGKLGEEDGLTNTLENKNRFEEDQKRELNN